MYDEKQMQRFHYAMAAVIIFLLVVIYYMWYECKYKSDSETMMSTAHWDQAGTYGHTPATLPSFGLSGYYADVPTDPRS